MVYLGLLIGFGVWAVSKEMHCGGVLGMISMYKFLRISEQKHLPPAAIDILDTYIYIL